MAVDLRRRWVLSAMISALGVLVMIAVGLARGPEHLVAGDGHYVFAAARSLAYDGDLDLGNQYWVMGDRWGLGRDPTTDHWQLPPREIGPSLVMVPGLWLHWLVLGSRGLGLEPVFACLGAAASLGLCWLGCVRALDAVAAELGLGPRSAEALGAAAVFGFVVPYYAVGASGYAHALDATIGAWLLAALLARARPLVIGALVAAAVLTRLQNGLWLLWPGVEVIRAIRASRADAGERQGWTPALARLATIAAIASLGLAPQLWLGLAHPGSDRGAWGWTLGFFNLDDYLGDLARVLAGVHGLVTWTPIAGLGLIGLGLAARDRRAWAGPALAVSLGLWLLLASVRDVDGGDAFGARRWAGTVGLVALGLAQARARVRIHGGEHPRAAWLPKALAGLLALLVAGNLTLTALALAGRLPLAAPGQTRGHR